MKEKPQNVKSNEIVRSPAHPLSGHAIWAWVRRSLVGERGYKVTLERLGLMIGRSISTTAHWLDISDQRHVQAFICLLERLSEKERSRFLREVCRTLPAVLHPRIAHAQQTVRNLLWLLEKQQGISVLRGGAPASRRFVLTALGHTFPQVDPRHRTVGGLDTQQPDKIVPVETMVYLRSQLTRDQIRRLVCEVWPEVKSSAAPLLLLNEVWSVAPDIQESILDAAKERHVVVADSDPARLLLLAHAASAPVDVLTVSESLLCPDRIQIACDEV